MSREQVHHKDMIDGIVHMTKQEKFFTFSRDGSLRAWNAGTLAHLKTIKVSDSWLTDAAHFEQSNRIGVSSIDRHKKQIASPYKASVLQCTTPDSKPA